jgi:hypothetical protein
MRLAQAWLQIFSNPLRLGANSRTMPSVDEELSQLDDGLRRLKIEFDIFFGGGAKKPPAELEWRVQSLLRKFSDGKNLSFSQRFRYSSLAQKYATFNSLWQQKLRIKEEGYRRPQDALLAIQGVRAFEDKPDKRRGDPAQFRMEYSNAEDDQNKIQELFAAMSEARKQAGEKGAAAGNFESFQTFVKKKTEQIRKEYKCKSVEYSVEIEKGQVKLKAKAGAK